MVRCEGCNSTQETLYHGNQKQKKHQKVCQQEWIPKLGQNWPRNMGFRHIDIFQHGATQQERDGIFGTKILSQSSKKIQCGVGGRGLWTSNRPLPSPLLWGKY